MLTSRSPQAERPGIVLVLVLAMLGLLALVGVTFATYAAQSRINNKQFMLSLFQPQADELIDFGLSQLITDTNDIRSVIRGHSLARDMFGNDATNNSLLGFSPSTGQVFSIVSVTQPNPLGQPTVFSLTTNIQSNDSSFFGYHFLRWALQLTYTGQLLNGGTGAITQSFEIIGDTGYNPSSAGGRSFTVNIPQTDQNAALLNPTLATTNYPNGTLTQLPGYYINYSVANNQPFGANSFTLDGRWLHAFNGPGMGQTINTTTGMPASYYPNFRYTGSIPALNQPSLGVPAPGSPGAPGMDEDYDACDLENWFLAIQSADGSVMIPSFHRPGIIRVDGNNNVNDWTRLNQSNPNGGPLFADSAARILRPCLADGHDASTFPNLVPDATGQIPYDVDNDGDGTTDSVWLDLGYPARKDASGRLYKPLYAFMVIGLNGRIPLNTAGNLAAQVGGFSPNDPNWTTYGPPSSIFGGQGTAVHLGNSMSEVDLTYALQNALSPPGAGAGGTLAIDGVATFDPPHIGYLYNMGMSTALANNTQVDNAGIDVRLTQLRNLLAGTRANDSTFQTNGESNTVFSSNSLTAGQVPVLLPNGIADLGDVSTGGAVGIDPGTSLPYVVRTSTPIPGRWGEGQSIPGGQFPNPANPMGMSGSGPAYVNVLGINYSNPVRAGYSINIRDILNGLAPDIADDNFNTYDPYPLRSVQQTDSGGTSITIYGGEVGDADYYDGAGALLFPAERMRRWVTPPDINGTGSVNTYSASSRTINRGGDNYGRVEFNSYFRPPGSPGVISTGYTVDSSSTGTGVPVSANGTTLGAIYFPQVTTTNNNGNYYGSGPNPTPAGITQTTEGVYPYLPDLASNPLHGLEAGRFPNQNYGSGSFTPQNIGGSPAGVMDPSTSTYMNSESDQLPTALPSYDYYATAAGGLFAQGTNANVHSDGLNDADEMNIYYPNPLYDSQFGTGDIEWLYRKQDVDGATLSSRLSQLAPVSFMNGVDGARRRRLFALDSMDLNTFSWTNDNPVQPTLTLNPATGNVTQVLAPVFPTNSRLTTNTNGGFLAASPLTTAGLGLAGFAGLLTPGLAQRDKKINLNYPLPVSNDPNETVRQKWINDTYQLLKSILPPLAVDTPEELAQLSQYVINIVDFRDTDSTMTHWVNPDVSIYGVPVNTLGTGALAVPTTAVTLVFSNATGLTNLVQLDQWGMEYNPVAINEVLAYSFLNNTASTGNGTRVNRFFMELVNTQTSPEISMATQAGFNPSLNLGGFVYNTPATVGLIDPYPGAAWDIIFTGDDPYSRPDPYRGQLVPYANLYAATPLAQSTFAPPTAGISTTNNPNNPTNPPTGETIGTAADGYDVLLTPLGYNASPTGGALATGGTVNIPTPLPTGSTLATGGTAVLPIDYFYVIGNSISSTGFETGSPGPTSYWPSTTGGTGGTGGTGNQGSGTQANATTYTVPSTTTPTQIQSFKTSLDPVTGTNATTSPITLYQGVLPGIVIPANSSATNTNPPVTTSLPSNYMTKLPTMGTGGTGQIAPSSPAATSGSGYYWVCLRRPANLFAPVSLSNPMVVVDSVRFPYLDGTGPLNIAGPAGGPTNVPNLSTAYAPYSIQRYQPFRGGHAVPVPAPNATTYTGTSTTSIPVDPRYGYTDQIVVPGSNSKGMSTRGIYYTGGGNTYYATNIIYHTLGWANEYEQGSGNSLAEPWDYFPFNDRDFTSVAELMLVPGCSPGLFTKQFVEFAPAAGTVSSIFSVVTPTSTPPTGGPLATIGVTASIQQGTNGTGANQTTTSTTTTSTSIQAFYTASLPFGYLYDTNDTATSGNPSTPQPRTYPYLNDEFFYSGFGGPVYTMSSPYVLNQLDTGGQVGGNGADGWFKMFEFFEVPSQAVGAIGPVASGSNFDWLRQDRKAGQLNLNLIMDEEVFFSVAGGQTISQTNGQIYDSMGNRTNASNQFSQNLLNFNQVQPIGGPGQTPVFYYLLGGSTPQYPAWMLAQGTSPVPLVVTSSLANGTPASATPIFTQATVSPGMTDTDPISSQFFNANNPATAASLTGPWWQYSNSMKAAWVQFLTLRHGGSGYLFGYGLGAPGQNSAVAPYTPPYGIPSTLTNNQWATGIPAERPFHSLSYPDINYTLMRPAVLPPSAYTNPVSNYTATTTTDGVTVYYAGDPGVRNPSLFLGYPTANYPGTLPATTSVGTTGTRTTPWGAAYEPVYPPAVPARRLFQVADSYRGSTVYLPATGLVSTTGPVTTSGGGATAVTDGASNASAAGDPFLNRTTPYPATEPTSNVPYYPTGALPPVTYTNAGTMPATVFTAALTRSNVDLYWPGGSAASTYDGTVGDPAVTVSLPSGVSNPHLGSNGGSASATNPGGSPDMREHPYWRSEQMQRLMNLTTPRTHQYAVWLTIGFFEVKRQGDLGMLAYNPTLAFDIMGPEIGAANGKSQRYRGFYLVDRLQLTGFNPSSPTGFKQALVYRQRIQ